MRMSGKEGKRGEGRGGRDGERDGMRDGMREDGGFKREGKDGDRNGFRGEGKVGECKMGLGGDSRRVGRALWKAEVG